ncbi:hypothetical protein SAMN05444166_4523 [Singulisphaera sp. GP187]|nr:hypothetical protein SAMN05444166_4523 [Singulisphaera sp. GP187]
MEGYCAAFITARQSLSKRPGRGEAPDPELALNGEPDDEPNRQGQPRSQHPAMPELTTGSVPQLSKGR